MRPFIFQVSKTSVIYPTQSISVKSRIKDLMELGKIRLSFSVVFSAIAGYLIAAPVISALALFKLAIGGIFVVTASNGYNQIIEKDRDSLMERTKNRPLPSLRMTVNLALLFSTLSMIAGLVLLYTINPLSAFFGAVSIFIYVLIYTPLKAKTPWAVFVGAIPGAIPFMIGWVAATNDFDVEPGALFAIQFLWQFPHFWAIAWLVYDDYARAGYYLLPTRKKDTISAFMTVIYSIWMVLISIIPYFGLTKSLYLSLPAAIIVFILGIFIVYKSLILFKERSDKSAKALMFASIMYLPLVQLVFVIDKFLQ